MDYRLLVDLDAIAVLDSIPKLGASGGNVSIANRRLAEIAGTVPALSEIIVGCAFAPRCIYAVERCRVEYPPLEQKAPNHWAACWESDRVVLTSAKAI